jgi:hypothetical protein
MSVQIDATGVGLAVAEDETLHPVERVVGDPVDEDLVGATPIGADALHPTQCVKAVGQ